jgi:hypothetical protein
MKSPSPGAWLVLGIIILTLFGGCTLLAGGVHGQWTPPFLIWAVLLAPLKLLNDRFQKVKWPMEFVMWSVILLITLSLLWLRYGVPE